MSHGPLTLRDYQENILHDAKAKLQELNSLLVTAPTGAGKTLILAEIMARIRQQQRRAALLVHRQELLKQSATAIAAQDPQGAEPGIVWKHWADWSQPITILAQDTVNSRELPPQAAGLDLLVIDEAHHAIAPSWLNTIHRLDARYLLGFSATPFRQDRESLSPEPFAEVVRPITPQELINRGILCPARIESPIIHDRQGRPQPVNQADNLVDIYAQAVQYAIAARRTKILLYVSPNRNRTPTQVIKRTAAALKQAGISAGVIAQDTTALRRSAALERFAAAAGVSVLINYMALTEGTDLPCVDCVIIGRHTLSESTIIQMIGRGLRQYPGKEDCLILDYTGRPDMSEIIHYWRLDSDREKNGGDPDAPEGEELNPPERLTRLELNELVAQFPHRLSPLDQARVEYPWFKPYPDKPIMALPLWSRAIQDRDEYITIEPLPRGKWRVTLVTLHAVGPAPLSRLQYTVPDADAAARMVRQSLGHDAPRISRRAPWRLKPGNERQQQAWRRLNPEAATDPGLLTAGELSDAITCARFQARVSPKVLNGAVK